ncbi:MAG UNVERIFIED_CONTAM: DNA mismatch repair protein MutT, partial [Thermobifida fusca]
MTEPPPTPDRHPDAVESAAPGGYLEPVRAAGTVLWRDTGRGREIALVHRP